jgi:glycosyltransferase involved in cell wall biosynthesis
MGRKMRIFIVPVNDLMRHPIPTRMYHIAKRLAEKHDVYLLSYTKHPLASRIIRRLNIAEIPVNKAVSTNSVGLYYFINVPQLYISIKRTIERENIDTIIHANILPSFIASKLAKKLKIPNIYDFQDYFPESASAYYVKGKHFIELGVKTFVYSALKNSVAIVTPSYGLKTIVHEIVPDKSVHVIPNGVDSELFKPMDQEIARKSIGLDKDYYLLLLQGSLDAWLDMENVMRILSKLRKSVDVRLLIVGFSHAKHYYRLLLTYAKHYEIDKYVYMYPPQPYERIPLFINSSDVVLAPYKRMMKNFATPLKVAEALACGKPVITTDIAEYKLWYKQGIYTYSTYAELENIIEQLLSNIDTIRATLRKNSYSFREAFSWDRLAERYERLLGSIV